MGHRPARHPPAALRPAAPAGLAPALGQALLTASKGLLLVAVTATAMRSRMELLLEAGWRATVPVLAATLASFAAALAFAKLAV